VTLNGGRARITMKLKRKYTPIYRDATVLSRPKTGLNDMTIELDPGNASAGELPGATRFWGTRSILPWIRRRGRRSCPAAPT